jgi:hypothetical protein
VKQKTVKSSVSRENQRLTSGKTNGGTAIFDFIHRCFFFDFFFDDGFRISSRIE